MSRGGQSAEVAMTGGRQNRKMEEKYQPSAVKEFGPKMPRAGDASVRCGASWHQVTSDCCRASCFMASSLPPQA